MNIFVDRMIRAAKLDVNLYEEVEADKSALGQAMAVVVISSIAAGLGRYQPGRAWWHLHRNHYGPYRLVYLGLSHLLHWYQTSTGTSNKGRSW